MKRSKSVMGRQNLFRLKNRTQPHDFGRNPRFSAAATLSRRFGREICTMTATPQQHRRDNTAATTPPQQHRYCNIAATTPLLPLHFIPSE